MAWRWYLPFLFTVIAGIAVTLVVFAAFRGSEAAKLKADFQNMAADRAQAIRAGLSEDFVELDLLADYVTASRELAGDQLGSFASEFGNFVRRIPLQEPDTQAVAFVARVPSAARAGFERDGARELTAGFQIGEQGLEGEIRPAGNRALYFPIAVIEPFEYTMTMLGLDLYAVPALKTALDHAVASGRTTASAGTILPPSTSRRPVVWFFRTVYQTTRGASQGRGELLGIVAIAFRIDEMVDLSLKDLSPAAIDVELVDPQAPRDRQSLYYRKARVPGYEVEAPLKSDLSWSTTLDAGERVWVFKAYPTREFILHHRSWQPWTLLAGGLLLTAMGSLYFAGGLRRAARVEWLVSERTGELANEVAKHEQLEKALAESRSTLASQVERLNLRNQEVQLLNEVGDMLQSCISTEEAYPLISLHAPRLLPGSSGALYIHDPSQDLYSAMAEWGDRPPDVAAFKAEDCWALRRGKVHALTGSTPTLRCRHTGTAGDARSLCIPMAATGKSIGLFHLTGGREDSYAFAVSVAEHIGLALSNLMLRSDLRQLSIHDPLTGLFNRRYMEETLEIEIRRAERTEHPIGVIMLDIDHFKTFNDRFGHAAGDEVLRALGTLIRTHLRAGDIACRYGGEEFVLILTEASGDIATQRAEDIRQRVKALEVRYLDAALGPLTVSLGVAVHPAHGRTRMEILAAADAALYKAKEGGRDQVVIAEITPR
ncbi:MAG: diguanylate cyclase [Spirochaetia bacterium]|jgi:diguanylate cyclase (GGDEF)-like protein